MSLWLPPKVLANRGYVEREGEIEELPIPPAVAAHLESGTRRYRYRDCTVLVAREGSRWHLSISHVERDPTWDEIAGARYKLVPDEAFMAQILPPRAEYTNVHEHCFHLWEIDADLRFGKEPS